MLRDTHSYETQIIDAVRSVNKALGGTYGTSSAIYKSEFNQYEVQLIDAIKGIGRTLSGNGLSLAGGVGKGEVSAQEFQNLSARVSKLESESFFRNVDGNITLKEQYQNLWVPGWLAAGGIGTGSGGGTSYLRELLDVYHSDSGILRGDGTSVVTGDVLVYDDTTDPTNPRWIAAAISAAGAVTNYGDTTTGRIATVGSVDIYNGVKWGAAGSTANTFTLTINGTTKTVCLDGYGGGGGGSVTGYIGTTQVQTTSAAQDLTGILSINATSNITDDSIIEWDSENQAWHFYGNVYADGWVAAHGIGTGSGGGGTGDLDLAAMWASLTNTEPDIYANAKIDIAHIPSITTGYISDLEVWITGKGYLAAGSAYTLRTPVTTSAANGVLLGVDALSNGSASVAGSDTSRIEWDNDHGAWHVYGNLYADGWVSAGGIGTGGTTVTSLSDLDDVTLTSLTDGQGLIWDATNSVWVNGTVGGGGDIYIGSPRNTTSLSDFVASTFQVGQVLYYAGGNLWTNAMLGLDDIVLPSGIASSSGYLYYDSVSGWALLSGGGGGGSTVSWGTTYSNKTVNLTVNGTTKRVCLNGYSSGSSGGSTVEVTPLWTTGTKIATISVDGDDFDLWAPTSGGGSGSTVSWGLTTNNTSPLTVDGTTKTVLLSGWSPDLSNYVTLSTTQTISGAKTFSANPVTIASTSGISVNSASYIDIGNARLVYDSGTNALHITKRSGTSSTISLYADGWVAAGGVSGETTASYVDLESEQTIAGEKTFSDAASFSSTAAFTGAVSLSSTLNVNGVTLSMSNNKLYVNKDARFTYSSGNNITISDIVERIVALENA